MVVSWSRRSRRVRSAGLGAAEALHEGWLGAGSGGSGCGGGVGGGGFASRVEHGGISLLDTKCGFFCFFGMGDLEVLVGGDSGFTYTSFLLLSSWLCIHGVGH